MRSKQHLLIFIGGHNITGVTHTLEERIRTIGNYRSAGLDTVQKASKTLLFNYCFYYSVQTISQVDKRTRNSVQYSTADSRTTNVFCS